MTSVSVRVLWPFMRLVPNCHEELRMLEAEGLQGSIMADPDARVPKLLGRALLLEWLEKTGDTALGLHAGECIESADFGVVHHAVRNSPNLRRALLSMTRYIRLLDDNLETVLSEIDDRCVWQYHNLVPSPLAALNDFQVAAGLTSIRGILAAKVHPLEVHLRHEMATNEAEYARFFRAPVRFGCEHNALVFPRALLDHPLALGSIELHGAFQHQAERMLEQLTHSDTVPAKVRQLLLKRLDEGNVHIAQTARDLHMSPATLRRRLAEAGTTHKDLLDELRRQIALHHVQEGRLSVGEVAFLLGFSSQSAFGKAFRRWVGSSPQEYRAQRRSAAPASAGPRSTS
ncbi:MAG TPA: AraC family transcriptional regulator [Polyangiaceae bacterium]|nr:AraC family transcriptional regulator [Polyangiaceae bacterium]